jgi:ABC-type uncharacterized transport system permease subunit
MKTPNTLFSRISMIMLLVGNVLGAPTLPHLIANQSIAHVAATLGTYALMTIAPILGIIQLTLLRKQARELSTRIAISYENVEASKRP